MDETRRLIAEERKEEMERESRIYSNIVRRLPDDSEDFEDDEEV